MTESIEGSFVRSLLNVYPVRVGAQVIKVAKGVPVTRMAAFKGTRQDAPIPQKQMIWSLSRNGLYSGDMLLVRHSSTPIIDPCSKFSDVT